MRKRDRLARLAPVLAPALALGGANPNGSGATGTGPGPGPGPGGGSGSGGGGRGGQAALESAAVAWSGCLLVVGSGGAEVTTLLGLFFGARLPRQTTAAPRCLLHQC